MIHKIYTLLLFCILSVVLCDEVINREAANNNNNPYSFYKKRNVVRDVDPHSFYFNTKDDGLYSKQQEYRHENEQLQKVENITHQEMLNKLSLKQNEEIKYKVYYSRLVKLILSRTQISKEEDGFLEGIINIEATMEEWKFLQDCEQTNVELKKIDHILSNVIIKPEKSFTQQIIFSFALCLQYLQKYEYIIYFTIVLAILIIATWKLNSSILNLIVFVMMCIICHSWYITHQDMLKEVVSKQGAEKLLYSQNFIDCDPSQRLWYQNHWWYKKFFDYSLKHCQDYVKAYTSPPLTNVTLLKSLSKTFLDIFSLLGTIFNDFQKQLTNDMNFVEKIGTLLHWTLVLPFTLLIVWFLFKILSEIQIWTPFTSIKLNLKSPKCPEHIEPVTKSRHKNVYLKDKSQRNKELRKLKYLSDSDNNSSIRVRSRKSRSKQNNQSLNKSHSDESAYYGESSSDDHCASSSENENVTKYNKKKNSSKKL